MALFSRRFTRISPRMGKEQLFQLARELLLEQEQIEALVQSLPIGVVILGRDFAIHSMNRAAKRCSLFAVQNLGTSGSLGSVATSSVPIWYELKNEELAKWLEIQLGGNSAPQGRDFLVSPNDRDYSGPEKVYRIETSSMVQGGLIEGWLILASDVTELAYQQRKNQQRDILSSLSTVTAGVAHEIKNPLAAMDLHVQLIRKLLHRESHKQQDQLLEYIGIVSEEIQRLNTFVTDFLVTVRPLELELRRHSLNDILMGVFELIHVEVEEKKIELEVDLAEQLPLVTLDPSMFKRLLLNVTQNSIQAIEERFQGFEGMEAYNYKAWLKVRTYSNDDFVFFELKDNGCGMSEETKKKLFEPFYTTRAKGSGLGMTMVLKVLQTHKGELQVQSELGVGTCLQLRLPRFEQEQKLLVSPQEIMT